MSDKPVPKRIKSMDELLMAVEPEATTVSAKSGVVRLKFSQVDPYPDHPFRLYSGERLEDMIASISNYGILTPMIVRTKADGRYEMLAGHNRMNAGKLAGLDEGDFIVKENLSDDEAWMYVIETNVMQRSFADMLISEKAAVLALRHSKMFSQGKRNDIIAELKMLEESHEIRGFETSAPVGQKLTSREKVGLEYGLSKNSVARLLRVDKLNNALKERIDNGEISIRCAVDLSYLAETEQTEVCKLLDENEFKIDMKKTDMLRSYSESSKLNEKTTYQILSGEINKKPKSPMLPPVKIKHKVYSKYFPADTKASEIERIVDEALSLYFTSKANAGATEIAESTLT